MALCSCMTGKERTGLVLGDDQRTLLVDDQGVKWNLQMAGEAVALENLLGCRVTVDGVGLGRNLRVGQWSVKDSGYGSQPHVGLLQRVGGSWRMQDRNTGALLELLAESLGPLADHEGDLVLIDGLVVGPHLIQVVSFRILIDFEPR